ncbi:hypothetical protein [Rhizobium sp. FKL33]|uniref:hypothetical protein n=1 Tax=Rhizobium sp. FKL33 TaxID=2562307 RepID=UPI0010C07596|nr:hypothetical protein [Rhizobium sp. FKL33]
MIASIFFMRKCLSASPVKSELLPLASMNAHRVPDIHNKREFGLKFCKAAAIMRKIGQKKREKYGLRPFSSRNETLCLIRGKPDLATGLNARSKTMQMIIISSYFAVDERAALRIATPLRARSR